MVKLKSTDETTAIKNMIDGDLAIIVGANNHSNIYQRSGNDLIAINEKSEHSTFGYFDNPGDWQVRILRTGDLLEII